jgi:hypothetical protein
VVGDRISQEKKFFSLQKRYFFLPASLGGLPCCNQVGHAFLANCEWGEGRKNQRRSRKEQNGKRPKVASDDAALTAKCPILPLFIGLTKKVLTVAQLEQSAGGQVYTTTTSLSLSLLSLSLFSLSSLSPSLTLSDDLR